MTAATAPRLVQRAPRWTGVARGLGALLLLGALSGPVRAQEDPLPRISDANLRAAWSGLSTSARRDVIEWLRLELSHLDSFQMRLLRFVVDAADVDPGAWPGPQPAPFFDPRVHAPGQPIPRRRLEPDDAVAVAVRNHLLGNVPLRRLESAWAYDWTSGDLVRLADDLEPERVFRNAVAGFPPELDYAEALVERLLDDGSQRPVLAAFGHAYTDRAGNVIPGVTLYDAWASGEAIEMPDVDNLGIVHTVLDDWKSWVAPVPAPMHDRFYGAVSDLFVDAHRHRALRTALARTYLSAVPVLRDGYESSLDQLHAIWEDAASTPATLRDSLPGPDDWESYLEGWQKHLKRKSDLRQAAEDRRLTLAGDAARVRATLVWVMRESGALAPPPVAPPAAVESGGPVGAPGAAPAIELDPERESALLEAVDALPRKRREDLIERCTEAALACGAPQVEAIAALTAGFEGDPAKLPDPSEPVAHDAKKFLGGPPRKTLRPPSKKWEELRALLGELPPEPWQRTVDYELATGRIVQVPMHRKVRRAGLWEIENLLAGVLPGQDLAEALVLRRLDARAPLREEAFFFDHLYCDREANAYADLTLYDMWSNHTVVEVPDVDARAYASIVWGDESLPVPLTKADQRQWYPRISSSLADLRRHRLVTRAIAAVWFQGRPELRGGYANSIDTLHGVIALEGGDLERVAARYERDGAAFVGRALLDVSAAGNEGWNAGNARRDALIAGRECIRQAVLAVLVDEGLLGT